MSEEFKPGQTVYVRSTGEKLVVKWVAVIVAVDECGMTWVKEPSDLVSVDPNEPKPQNCPVCGNKSECSETQERHYRCYCDGLCGLYGPIKPTRLDAVKVWNSLSSTRDE